MNRTSARRASVLAARLLLSLAVPGAAATAAAQEITLKTPPQSTKVFARDGSLLAEFGPQVRTWVAMRTLPAYVPRTFVAVEDRRFYDHEGVDPVGIARAAVKIAEGGRREGASTITQQLIGTMYPERVNRQDITLERKVREARLAVELEQRYGKDRILESYLNWIYFGHGWFGIEAAAQHYFGKPAAKLNHEETAMLAALPKGAGVYSPKINAQRALERRNLVLDIMAREGVISAAEAAAAKMRPIRLAPNHGYAARPPYVLEQVRQYLAQTWGPGYDRMALRVWTTIDPVAQNAADSSLVRGLRAVEKLPWYRGPRHGEPAAVSAAGTRYLQGLVVSLDARTGEILAMTGGRDWEHSKFNRVTMAQRQPGSSFKPFVYAAALQRGLTPATLMQDTALRIELPGSAPYAPKNSDDLFRGPVTMRQALTQSINTIAIQLGSTVGYDRVVAEAKRYGITSRIPAYPSSMIGAGSVKPLELAAAYTVFANRGLRAEPFLVRRVTDASGRVLFDARARVQRVLSPEVAFLVTDMLEDAAEKGTGTEARQRLPARVPMAGKTGTTDNATDVWYVGYTPEVVTAVWVGFDTPRSIGASAYGGTLAAPIWGDMMRQLYARRRVPAAWAVPPGLVGVATDPMTGQPALAPACPVRPGKLEYFPVGAEPAGACVVIPGSAPARVDSVQPDTVSLDSLLGVPLPADTTGADTARSNR